MSYEYINIPLELKCIVFTLNLRYLSHKGYSRQYEMVYLTFREVADAPFHIQGVYIAHFEGGGGNAIN